MNDLLREITPPFAYRGLRRLLGRSNGFWTELERLRRLPRYQSDWAELGEQRIRITDGASFFHAYRQIFVREIYRFASEADDPVIIEGGGNVGLAVLYWKSIFPKAHIRTFEPDPAAFEALKQNCGHLEGVEVVKAGLWSSDGRMPFVSEGADGGRLTDAGDSDAATEVDLMRLRDLLDEPVAFLKLDVEGAEVELLNDCDGALGQVQHIFVEYHSFPDKTQELDSVFGVLRRAGFRLSVESELVPRRPFVERSAAEGHDLRLNIFGFRVPGGC